MSEPEEIEQALREFDSIAKEFADGETLGRVFSADEMQATISKALGAQKRRHATQLAEANARADEATRAANLPVVALLSDDDLERIAHRVADVLAQRLGGS